jgi:hypothetical protein
MSENVTNTDCYRDYEENDPSFIADLRKSKDAVAVAAEWLSAKGYPVVIRPTFERPSVEQMGEYSDDGDIEIVQRVEVKRRQNLTFTSKEDFPYETIIVDACHCYDKARPKPYLYIIFNREMTAAFVVDVKHTLSQWQRVMKRDRFKGRNRVFYECPLSAVSFVRIER